MEKQKQRPVHEIVVPFNGSLLRAAIWRHSQEDMRRRFSVSISRAHREKKDGKWVSAGFYNRDDCLGLGRIAELAHSWMLDNSKKETKNE